MLRGVDPDHPSLGQRLEAARDRAFVGREEEQALFRSALGSELSFMVLFVHGSGGIGKSALLRRFAAQAAAAGRPVVTVDGRTVDPSPAGFEAEAGQVFTAGRAVLLIDTFERCQGLEGWLRERFLPRVPAGALVVVAGRNPPDLRWQADPGWAEVLRVIRLRTLAPREAMALIDARGVTEELREPLLAFAGGHPLALCLGAAVAAKDDRASARWTVDRDIPEELAATLLDQLVGEVPSAAHRHALEVCAHAHATTEELLRAVLPDHPRPLFGWLRRLPFVESGRHGLFPHDVVRDALEADLRWRDPEGYADMHHRIHAHLAAQVRAASGQDALAAMGSLFFLHRHDGVTAEFQNWRGDGEVHEEPFHPEDRAEVLRMAAEAEGETSAADAAYWIDRQPEGFWVHRRTETGEPVALMSWVRVSAPAAPEAACPLLGAAWRHAADTAPPRPGEHVALARAWVLPRFHGRSPVMDLVQWRAVGECLRSDRLAWTFLVMREPDSWRRYLRHYDMHDLGARIPVGGETFGLFAHDWRTITPEAWLERLSVRGLGLRAPAAPQGGELRVLARSDFDTAVRDALRNVSRPEALAGNPLARCRLVAVHPAGDPAQAVRDLLEQAVEQVRQDPRADRFHRALVTTYYGRVPTQEAAAERLGLPFSTYRRHLAAGLERVAEILWHQEVFGARPDA
ncbi:AAA family ATPase [Nonomuraea sp. MCN248]|uniref:AAA family ATPase n=1 Tax=Nonomuraea corallina TaxID=2989783 RepID=A0ABT4S741_9ACTN|nr:AAA family ATPase [Nonomuraea corallina]MDA0632868.1 AAA family ATPase [Nonomuraea corallina]